MALVRSRPWRRPPWTEPRFWILLMGAVLFLPWCVVAAWSVGIAPQPSLPALVVLLENPFVEGPGSFLIFGLGAVIALALAAAAYLAVSSGRLRTALIAASGYAFGGISFVVLVAAAHAMFVTYLAVTPLAATLLVSVPGVVSLAHAFLREAPETDRPRMRARFVAAEMGLLGLGALGWTVFAVRVILHVPEGLSDRTYPDLAIFLAGVGTLVYFGLAMIAVAFATRRERSPARLAARGIGSPDPSLRDASPLESSPRR